MPGPPRVVTVLAGLGLLLLVLALLAVVSPAVRDQARLTLTRQDAPYVETSFARVDEVRACSPRRGRFTAELAVRSHLDEAADVPYVMTLTPVTGAARPVTVDGVVATLPGRESVVQLVGRKPARAFTAAVTFPGREQRLLVRCGGPR